MEALVGQVIQKGVEMRRRKNKDIRNRGKVQNSHNRLVEISLFQCPVISEDNCNLCKKGKYNGLYKNNRFPVHSWMNI